MKAQETEDQRPDPEQLLEAVKREEERRLPGKLKIFLGMAAGVGKTYTMLDAAQQLQREGVNVLVGTINTHGRKETASRIEGLKILPEKWITYKDTVFEELDLDGVIELKPDVVLIDELAHTNVPGSRHPKRWQDVMEILDNGIDVYTTLNVQHIESLKDVVEGIAGITIRETVPDGVIDAASDIEIIDLTPSDLLQRLKEGKVYLGPQSETAMRHFFQEDRLTALREIVLRYAAEKVDRDLHGMVASVHRESDWKPRDRLLVAVSTSPHSQKLIRATRRQAIKLEAPWVAVYVDTDQKLSEKQADQLYQNLTLARELDAEVITTHDSSVSHGIGRIARQKGVTELVIGRSPSEPVFGLFPKSNISNELIQECGNVDIFIIKEDEELPANTPSAPYKFRFFEYDYFYSFLSVILLSLSSWFLEPLISYKMIGLVFLLFIITAGMFVPTGPMMFAASLLALVWNFFFVPPTGSLSIKSGEDLYLIVLFLATAFVTSHLATKAIKKEKALAKREKMSQNLFEILRHIATSKTSADLLPSIGRSIEHNMGGDCRIIPVNLNNELKTEQITPPLHEKEIAALTWVFENGKEAGWSTNTLPALHYLYIPLKGAHEIMGVLAFRSHKNKLMNPEEKQFLLTVAEQLAHYLERTNSEEREFKSWKSGQAHQTHETIFNMIQSGFKTPLNETIETIEQIKNEATELPENTSHEIKSLENKLDHLRSILENVSSISMITSNFLPSRNERNSIIDLVNTVLETLKSKTHGCRIQLESDEALPLIPFDFSLLELLVCNIILEAIEGLDPNEPLLIDLRVRRNYLFLRFSGVKKNFEKKNVHKTEFRYILNRTIAELHQGEFSYEEQSDTFCYQIRLPLQIPDW